MSLAMKKEKFAKLKKTKTPRSVPTELVSTRFFTPDSEFPIVVSPAVNDLSPGAWGANNRKQIDLWLNQHAAIVFRGFDLKTPQDFEAFAQSIYPDLYGQYGDLPKKDEGKKTYKSTPYPENQMILYHNESSHIHQWPLKQWFFSEVVAKTGGATPIVDCRKMYQLLPVKIRQKLEQKKLLYVRNFTNQLDVRWQDFYKTDDKKEVERQCDLGNIKYKWFSDNELQTRSYCPAVITHPQTGEKSFFNQVQLHHIFCLEPEVRQNLLETVGLERMPRNVYYGDGTEIEDDVMATIGQLYEDCAVRFDWQVGDVVMVDNMLVAHARDPFEGERKIVVAMGDLIKRESF